MAWCTTFDLDQFAAAAGGYLGSKAAENTLLLSAVQAARAGGHTQATAQEPAGGGLFGWGEPPGRRGGGRGRGGFPRGGAPRAAASRAARSCTSRRRRC